MVLTSTQILGGALVLVVVQTATAATAPPDLGKIPDTPRSGEDP